MSQSRRTLVVGVGSDHGDDRLGWLVVDWLRPFEGEIDAECLRTPLDLLSRLNDVERLLIVDAAQGADPPGSAHRYEWPAIPTHNSFCTSTHGLGITQVLALADTLGVLPNCTVLLLGVVPPMAAARDEISPIAAGLVRSLGELALAECRVHATVSQALEL